jgi:hypothetical protein
MNTEIYVLACKINDLAVRIEARRHLIAALSALEAGHNAEALCDAKRAAELLGHLPCNPKPCQPQVAFTSW